MSVTMNLRKELKKDQDNRQLSIEAAAWGLTAIEILRGGPSFSPIIINDDDVARKAVWLARYAREEAEESNL